MRYVIALRWIQMGWDYSFAANCTLVVNPEATFEAAETQAPPPLPEPPKAALSPATFRLVRIKAGKKHNTFETRPARPLSETFWA